MSLWPSPDFSIGLILGIAFMMAWTMWLVKQLVPAREDDPMADNRTPEQIIAAVQAVIEAARELPGAVDLADPAVRLVPEHGPDGTVIRVVLAEPAKA